MTRKITQQEKLLHDLANSITALDFLWHHLHRQYQFTPEEKRLGEDILRQTRTQLVTMKGPHSD